MPRLLVVHHSPTAGVRLLSDAAVRAARTADGEGVDIVERFALDAGPDDVLSADGYLFGTTANFGYISGALKHFFDITYTDTHTATRTRPFSYWIHGGHDTTGAERALQSITTGYGLRLAAEPLLVVGAVTNEEIEAAAELGATMAWGLAT